MSKKKKYQLPDLVLSHLQIKVICKSNKHAFCTITSTVYRMLHGDLTQPASGSGIQFPHPLMKSEEANSSTRVCVQCERCDGKPLTLINLDVDDSPILWGKH